MTDTGEAERVPSSSGFSSGAVPGFTAAGGLPGRVRSLSSPAPSRLTSLRTRDMTLGGAFKKAKKTFEPNVYAVRKSKDELKEENHVLLRKERLQSDKSRRENRGRRRERPQTIQCHSIFEQGPADNVRKTGCRGSTDLQDAATSPMCKLVKKGRRDWEEPDDDEEEILNKLEKDDFIDDPCLRNDAKLKPIQLPLCQTLSKATPGPENRSTFNPSSHTRTMVAKTEQPLVTELLQELNLSGREELFFMQLPDCMPARDSTQEADTSLSSTGKKAAKKEGKLEEKRPAHLYPREDVAKEGHPVLSQLPEGFLGKLQIRKSGKVELKLGHIVMDVSEGAAFSFLQQLVSVRLSDGRTGEMMVLGNVQHKLVLSPDFQGLLKQAPTQQQDA